METTVAVLTNYFCFVFMLFRMKNDLGGEENTLPPNLVISACILIKTNNPAQGIISLPFKANNTRQIFLKYLTESELF